MRRARIDRLSYQYMQEIDYINIMDEDAGMTSVAFSLEETAAADRLRRGDAVPRRAAVADRNRPASAREVLSVRDVHVRFGGVAALAGAGFAVADGEICGLIGPNGAGKTTLFNCISGLTRVDSGEVVFAGQRIDGVAPHVISGFGISRTFQNLGLYPEMTVLENVLLGGRAAMKSGFVATALRLPFVALRERALREAAFAVIDTAGLSPCAGARAGSLPYGTMKRVELARALLAQPRLLLLDEPAGGLAHGEVEELAELIRVVRHRHSLTILLVEHHMKFVMGLCDHVVVLHLGATLANGRPDDIKRDPRVIAAYLGAA
jgi:branched-chain amino acid transport system ATP-binding protein